MFYLTIGICGVLGWLVSEAYLHPQVKYFDDVAALPNLKKENMGKNFIFLSFNDLTSINNIKKMNSDRSQNKEIFEKAYNNALGFYHKNNFYSRSFAPYLKRYFCPYILQIVSHNKNFTLMTCFFNCQVD